MDVLDAAMIFTGVLSILYYGYFFLGKGVSDDESECFDPPAEEDRPEAAA